MKRNVYRFVSNVQLPCTCRGTLTLSLKINAFAYDCSNLLQHPAPSLKWLKTAFPETNRRSKRHRSLTWEPPLDHCCTSVSFRVSAFLRNIQCWKQLRSSPQTLSSLFCRPWAYFFSPQIFILLKGTLSVYFSQEKQSIKLISSYPPS